MYETSLDKVLNYMKQYVENRFEHDSEPMLNYKDLELVLNYINKQKEVLNKIKEELTGDFNFEVYICNDNKGSGKTMKLGASIYRNMILEKLNKLLEEIE
jgi:hypothetical protein